MVNLAICDPRSPIVQSLLDCRLSDYPYLMIIEYFGHFSMKHKRRYAEDIREQVEMAIKPSAVMFYRK